MVQKSADIEKLELSNREFNDVNILIVEDNSVCERFYKSLLVDYGFNVDTAENGKVALDQILNHDYDIILMDIIMPEMDGYETTDKIRQLPEPKNQIPIIAITSLPSVDKKKLKNMNHLISKPFNHIQLIRTIDMVLSMKDEDVIFEDPIKLDPAGNDDVRTRFKYIDLKNVENLAAGKSDFIKEMIDMFIGQNKEVLMGLKVGIEDKNLENIRQLAHKMIMSLHIMGMKELEEIAMKIERYIDSNTNTGEVYSLTSELIRKGNEAILELKLYRSELENS